MFLKPLENHVLHRLRKIPVALLEGRTPFIYLFTFQ